MWKIYIYDFGIGMQVYVCTQNEIKKIEGIANTREVRSET